MSSITPKTGHSNTQIDLTPQHFQAPMSILQQIDKVLLKLINTKFMMPNERFYRVDKAMETVNNLTEQEKTTLYLKMSQLSGDNPANVQSGQSALESKTDIDNYTFKLTAVRQATETLCKSEIGKLIDELNSDVKNAVYGKIYKFSKDPNKGGDRWGEEHRLDNLDVLINALNKILSKEETSILDNSKAAKAVKLATSLLHPNNSLSIYESSEEDSEEEQFPSNIEGVGNFLEKRNIQGFTGIVSNVLEQFSIDIEKPKFFSKEEKDAVFHAMWELSGKPDVPNFGEETFKARETDRSLKIKAIKLAASRLYPEKALPLDLTKSTVERSETILATISKITCDANLDEDTRKSKIKELVDELDPNVKNSIYGRIHSLSQDPDKNSDPYWGEKNVTKNLDILLNALLAEVLDKQDK